MCTHSQKTLSTENKYGSDLSNKNTSCSLVYTHSEVFFFLKMKIREKKSYTNVGERQQRFEEIYSWIGLLDFLTGFSS